MRAGKELNDQIKMSAQQQRLLVVAIIISAIIMRTPIVSVGPLIVYIKESFSLSNATAGVITSIPLLAFAVVSPFISKAANKLGTGKIMLLAAIFIGVGILVRSYLGLSGFFVGTVVIGAGIAAINVMLPSISRTYFPLKFGVMTSLYVTVMSVFSSASTAISVPLASTVGFGWQNALVIWLAIVVASLIIWTPFRNLRNDKKTFNDAAAEAAPIKLYKSTVAWWLSAYTGIQALLFYCFIAWLPTMLQAKGLTPEMAGYMAAVYQISGVVASFTVPIIAERFKDQRPLVVTLSSLYLLAMIGLLVFNDGALLIISLLLLGFCGAAGVGLSMLFIGLRSSSPTMAARLSGMSQSVGYALATIGPFTLGRITDATGSWTTSTICMIAVIAIMVFVGFKIGKNRTV